VLSSLQFANDRTALATIETRSNSSSSHHHHHYPIIDTQFISLLRIDGITHNDGWQIVRNVICQTNTAVPHSHRDDDDPPMSSQTTSATAVSSDTIIPEIARTVQQYLDVEHGGGRLTRHMAEHLFHTQASILSVPMKHNPNHNHKMK
jgi:hypothetical protein